MITKLINKILGDQNEKELKKLWPIVEKIKRIEEEYQTTLTDEDIPKKTQEFKDRIATGESLNKILPEAFALVKNACRRLNGRSFDADFLFSETGEEEKKYVWNMVPYDVQLLGGIALHQGKIAEMKTGEGKTLVCTLPLYLNALTGKGVFLVTANEYLVKRDASWMGILYNFLGLTVGTIHHNQTREFKQAAYNADITYGTNNEYGFDYLRDNMAVNQENMVQRNLFFAIVDEVDSILIDEARTPLIISAPAEESTDKYIQYSKLVKQLVKEEDYLIDEKQKAATLTEAGIAKMENLLGVENIYTDAGFLEVHHIEQSLKAEAIFKNDIDYVVKEGEIVIVDEFTGRLMFGRRYSDGLHQAIEAKENVVIQRESKTLATVTFQNYFRLFEKLAGMTGTAKTEAEEFLQIYNLDTLAMPTNKEVKRLDQSDMIFKNRHGKYLAVASRVQEAHAKGQPALIGTISIEQSEILSNLLKQKNIPHAVLNAKFHEQEAEIISKAGYKGAVTIATNMAGRGTDIKLDDESKAAGGLLVIGTERHESRRIDNQLRGRSGRQGDPGESQFFVSMEDDLMRLFGADRIKRVMEAMQVPDEMPIQNKMLSGQIESAQKKVEGRNFDIRKHLVEYDDVMNKHREIIYARRRKMLFSENIKNDIIVLIEKEAERLIQVNYNSEDKSFDYERIIKDLESMHDAAKAEFNMESFKDQVDNEALIEMLKMYLFEIYEKKEKALPDESIMRQLERNVYLSIIDSLWMEHIDNMQDLRESVSLRGYGQRDPLIEYKEIAFQMFDTLLRAIEANTVSTLFKLNIKEIVPVAQAPLAEPEIRLVTNEDQIKDQSNAEFPELHVKEENITDWVFPGSHPSELQDESSKSNDGIRVIKADTNSSTGTSSANSTKSGRNELCPTCGKKIKKCPFEGKH